MGQSAAMALGPTAALVWRNQFRRTRCERRCAARFGGTHRKTLDRSVFTCADRVVVRAGRRLGCAYSTCLRFQGSRAETSMTYNNVANQAGTHAEFAKQKTLVTVCLGKISGRRSAEDDR